MDSNTQMKVQTLNAGWRQFITEQMSLARHISEILLVRDYSITVTSNAAYSYSDFQKITINDSS